MKVITVASDINNFFVNKFLIPSCQYFDLDLVVLNPLTTWHHHKIKDQFLAYYLKGLDPDEIVLFTDAYDTLLINDFAGIIDAYHRFNANIVFSSEINCWPEPALLPIYHKIAANEDPVFLNSGGFIGKVSSIAEILHRYPESPSHILHTKYKFKSRQVRDYDENYQWSNQYYWTMVYFSQPDAIDLDKDSKLFLTLGMSVSTFDANYQEYRRVGTNSKIFTYEFDRIRDVLRTINYGKTAHLHFNNPISKHVLFELFKREQLPDWIIEILTDNHKSVGKSKTIVTMKYNEQTGAIEKII
ncbi:hypothetical protein QQ020_00255 [Fulvivirgaceae bacterium BMA12]|uniref:PLOD1-3-like GT domain-containing protein n=1 Tax=Agaribacillus aureus TaxID=3051825 RepID=A0ABT8L063_9BACT|nr:hypothetical protein [Fulvivirgaceae bacterium BMA12]